MPGATAERGVRRTARPAGTASFLRGVRCRVGTPRGHLPSGGNRGAGPGEHGPPDPSQSAPPVPGEDVIRDPSDFSGQTGQVRRRPNAPGRVSSRVRLHHGRAALHRAGGNPNRGKAAHDRGGRVPSEVPLVGACLLRPHGVWLPSGSGASCAGGKCMVGPPCSTVLCGGFFFEARGLSLWRTSFT